MIVLKTKMSRAHEILKFFEDVPKTESAFYLRFQSMNIEDIEFLKSFYKETEQWRVFCKICSFFNVKVA